MGASVTSDGHGRPASIDFVKVFTELGVLLVPASLIALFCQIMDVSSRNTGALSLLTVVLAAICLYRKPINKYVPATVALALLTALGAVFYFNYENILLKDTGLIRYYKQSNDFLGATIDAEIRSAKHDIWFAGTNFNVTAGERRDLILKRLADGVSVRYLIYDPQSAGLPSLARDFDQSPEELRAECEKGLQSILEIRRRWELQAKAQASSGVLEVRLFETHPHARFYYFDPENREGHSYFIPYNQDTNSPTSPGFLLQNIDGGVSLAYFTGVRKLWQRSRLLQ